MMTDNHRHWSVKVPTWTLPLWRIKIWRSSNKAYVIRSRFPYTGRTPDVAEPDDEGYWYLSILGFLHGLTGFTIRVD